jgi:hypothetical protein
MNCAGVAVFYGAQDKDTAISEIRPAVGSYVVVGEFKVIRPLRLLHLETLGEAGPGFGGSPFDPDAKDKAVRGQFLKVMTRTLAMPVVPQLQHRDYLTTQAIADFLATHRLLQLDGIIFPSTQHPEDVAGEPRRNVILFRKASTVAGSEAQEHARYGVQLYERDGESEAFAPQIFPNVAAEAASGNDGSRCHDLSSNKPALELDTGTIAIHKIKSMELTADVDGVYHHRMR